jgi:hypothetical protein
MVSRITADGLDSDLETGIRLWSHVLEMSGRRWVIFLVPLDRRLWSNFVERKGELWTIYRHSECRAIRKGPSLH